MSGSSAMDYGALAETIEISDITSNEGAAKILRELRDNEPIFGGLRVSDNGISFDDEGDSDDVDVCDCVFDARGMGIMGYYLGRNTKLEWLFVSIEDGFDIDVIGPFFVGLQSNRSIQKMSLHGCFPSRLSQMLAPFIEANSHLEDFSVDSCRMDANQYRALSLALRGGKCLKRYYIDGIVDGDRYEDEQSIIANIEALKLHPQLEQVQFRHFVLGKSACTALSGLVQQLSAGLRKLTLNQNDGIDDSGVEALADGLAHCRGLQQFQLSECPAITARGWRALSSALSTLLEDPQCSLGGISLTRNSSIDAESAIIFASALARNSTLNWLWLEPSRDYAGSTGTGWEIAFSNALCDTASVNGTFHSNHSLTHLTVDGRSGSWPDDGIVTSLALNQDSDKRVVAIRKILLHHKSFDLQPLLEWDLKVLPLVIEWLESACKTEPPPPWMGGRKLAAVLERAAVYGTERDANMSRRKLAAIYQFIRGMPEYARVDHQQHSWVEQETRADGGRKETVCICL